MRKLLVLNPKDNIAVALAELNAGENIDQDNLKFKVLEAIPRGHKIATCDIKKSAGIIKYGERMGHAIKEIPMGAHVHVHNVLGDRLSPDKQ